MQFSSTVKPAFSDKPISSVFLLQPPKKKDRVIKSYQTSDELCAVSTYLETTYY